MPGWKFLAQRLTTGEFLDMEVPFSLSSNPRRDLSGPGGMSGTISPEYARLIGSDGRPIIQEWSTAIYAEVDGKIRWGGIVSGSSFNGGEWQVECVGFTGYASGIPYLGSRIRAGIEVPGKSPDAGKDRNNDGYVDYTTPPNTKRVRPVPPSTYTDPVETFDVVRKVWDEVQRHPYGDIGLIIDKSDSGHMLGKPVFQFAPDNAVNESERIKAAEKDVKDSQQAFTEAKRDGSKNDIVAAQWNLDAAKEALLAEQKAQAQAKKAGGYPVADPYELVWWEYPDCGQEIDELARQAPFDYLEDHDWAGSGPVDPAGRPWGHPDYDRPAGKNRYGVEYTSMGMDRHRRPKGHPDFDSPAGQDRNGNLYRSGTSNGEPADKQIVHRLRLAHPRLGAQRKDLSFVQGENIIGLAQPSERGDFFANEVIGVGKGEGTSMVVTRIPRPDGRLRRTYMLVDKTIGSKTRLDSKVREQLTKRAQGLTIPMIEIVDHPNAPIGSWNPGDDILVEVKVPWVGAVSIWHRIVGDELVVGNTALLSLVRSDTV